MKELQFELDRVKTLLAEQFSKLFPKNMPMQTVLDACAYSLNAGGKRLRPFLLLEFCNLHGGAEAEALPFAMAMEMIHTYSLIHDDLPAMDNDDFRRGRLTNHKVFGEAMAILAGDGLLNLAFETALSAPCSAEKKVAALQELARASGVYGMIGGQTVDIENEQYKKKPTAEQLIAMHGNKTGALIEASCKIGCILAGAGEEATMAALSYGKHLGIAFQITDDILDVVGDFETVGKTLHKDENSDKTTFVDLFGLEESRKQGEHYVGEACKALQNVEGSQHLQELAKGLIDRKK